MQEHDHADGIDRFDDDAGGARNASHGHIERPRVADLRRPRVGVELLVQRRVDRGTPDAACIGDPVHLQCGVDRIPCERQRVRRDAWFCHHSGARLAGHVRDRERVARDQRMRREGAAQDAAEVVGRRRVQAPVVGQPDLIVAQRFAAPPVADPVGRGNHRRCGEEPIRGGEVADADVGLRGTGRVRVRVGVPRLAEMCAVDFGPCCVRQRPLGG